MIKEITPYNFDEILFEYFEGTLSDAEKKNFLDFVEKNPSYKKDLELWEQSFVATDNIEVPEGLEELYLKKESFWKSSGGKIAIGIGIAAAITTSALLMNKGETEEKDSKPSVVNLNATQDSTAGYAPATPSPMVNPFANAPAQEKNAPSLKSEKQTRTVPSALPMDMRTFTNAEPETQSTQINIDTINNRTNVSESNATVGNNAKADVKDQKSDAQASDKKSNIDPKLKSGNLGRPKNIIDMDQKLDEN